MQYICHVYNDRGSLCRYSGNFILGLFAELLVDGYDEPFVIYILTSTSPDIGYEFGIPFAVNASDVISHLIETKSRDASQGVWGCGSGPLRLWNVVGEKGEVACETDGDS